MCQKCLSDKRRHIKTRGSETLYPDFLERTFPLPPSSVALQTVLEIFPPSFYTVQLSCSSYGNGRGLQVQTLWGRTYHTLDYIGLHWVIADFQFLFVSVWSFESLHLRSLLNNMHLSVRFRELVVQPRWTCPTVPAGWWRRSQMLWLDLTEDSSGFVSKADQTWGHNPVIKMLKPTIFRKKRCV